MMGGEGEGINTLISIVMIDSLYLVFFFFLPLSFYTKIEICLPSDTNVLGSYMVLPEREIIKEKSLESIFELFYYFMFCNF